MYDERPMTLAKGINEFERIFYELTNNLWNSRKNKFEKHWDKMNMLNAGLFTMPVGISFAINK